MNIKKKNTVAIVAFNPSPCLFDVCKFLVYLKKKKKKKKGTNLVFSLRIFYLCLKYTM